MLRSATAKYLLTLLLSIAVLTTAGCGFNLRGVTQIPRELQVLELQSSDPYGPISRAIYKELKQNNVTVIEGSKDQSIPSLRILNVNQSRNTVSVFRDGKTAEYQLMMSVQGQILLPGSDVYPFETKVYRTFFDNPLTALAKDSEQDIILGEMRELLAKQVLRKLLTVKNDLVSQPVITN